MKLSRFMLLIWLPIHLLLSGCCQTVADSADGLAEIDIVNSLGKYHAIPVSEFMTELEYIPLETGNDCLIARVENVIVTSTHIFITSRNRCYAFDRVGRFIRQIGGIGQGPGEYTNLSGISIDEINRSLYLETPRNLLEYSWDGGFRRSIQKPVQNEFHAEKTVFVRDGVFIGHYPNPYGNDMYHYQLFNESGQVVKSFDNPVRFEPAGPGNVLPNYTLKPFRMGGNIYVKEDFNDTLYCVNEHYELVPQFVFNFGKYVMSKEKRVQPFRGDMSVLDDVLMTSLLVGIPNHLFFELYVRDVSRFSVSFPAKPQRRETDPPPNTISIRTLDGSIPFGIYDIVNQKIRLLDTDTFSRKSGLINDLDGGFSFWPRYCSSDNELIGVRYAHEMKETLTEEYFATREIRNPQAHQKLREFLNKLQEDDNPVVVIAKLKD